MHFHLILYKSGTYCRRLVRVIATVWLCHSGKTSDLGILDLGFLTQEPSLRDGNTLKLHGNVPFVSIYTGGNSMHKGSSDSQKCLS